MHAQARSETREWGGGQDKKIGILPTCPTYVSDAYRRILTLHLSEAGIEEYFSFSSSPLFRRPCYNEHGRWQKVFKTGSSKTNHG